MPVITGVRVLLAVALAVVAIVHLKISPNYADIGSPLSLRGQFVLQGIGGLVLAAAVLVPLVRSLGRLDPLVWLGALGYGVVSLGPLVYSRYKPLPIPGFPGGFQETWEVEGAVLSAVSESAVIVLALVGLALTLSARSRTREPAAA